MSGLRWVLLKGPAKVQHEGVDCSCGRGPLHPPDIFEQFSPRYHHPLVLDQVPQQLHLKGGQPHRLVVAADLPRVKVHLHLSEVEAVVGPCWCITAIPPAAEQATDHREQLIEVKRLLQIDIGSSIEAPDPVLYQRAGRQHHHWHQAAARAERLTDRVATHAGQHEVENDQIDLWIVLVEHRQGLVAVGNGRDSEAFRGQVVLDADGEMVLVLDEEDVWHDDV